MTVTVLQVPPANVSPRSSGTYRSGEQLQFIIPPQKTSVSMVMLTGQYRIIDRTDLAHRLKLSANNLSYDVCTLVGAFGLMATSEVLKAYTANTLDKITQQPTVVAAISLTRHPNDWIAKNWGTMLDPGLRFTPGRTRGFGRFDNTKCWYQEAREFAIRPFNGIFQGKKLDLELLNGLQFQSTISRVSDCFSYYGPVGSFGVLPAYASSFKSMPGHYMWGQSDPQECSAPSNMDIEIIEPLMYVVLEQSDSQPVTSFTWPTVDVYRQPRPSTTTVQLALPIGLQTVKIVNTFIMSQYDSQDLAHGNLSVLSTKRSDFEATKNGQRLKFRYSTQQMGETTRITTCTSNTIAVAALRIGVSRSSIARKVARGSFNELTFNASGNGDTFRDVTWQYKWVLRPIISAFYTPFSNGTTTQTTMRQEEYYVISCYTNLQFFADAGAGNQTMSECFIPYTAASLGIYNGSTTGREPVFISAFNQKDVYKNSYPTNNLGDNNVLTLVSTISTLSLGSDASTAEQVSTGPEGKSVSTDLFLDECAPASPVARVVQQRIVCKVLPWSLPGQSLLEIRLPTSGLQTSQMYLRFRLGYIGTGLFPGSVSEVNKAMVWTPPNGTKETHVNDLLFNRLQYPCSIGNAAHIRSLYYDLPNGTTVEVPNVADDQFLNLYGSTQEATLIQTEFTNKRSDAWCIGTSNAHYEDFHHHRSFDYVGRCFDSAAPYAIGSLDASVGMDMMDWTDYRIAPKTFVVNLSSVCEIMEKTSGLPYLSNQSRTIRVVLDLRGITMAYQPGGVGNEAMGSFDPAAMFQVINPLLPLDNYDCPRLECELDHRYTPILETYVAYLDASAQAAIQNKYAAEGYTYRVSHFTRFQDAVVTDSVQTFSPLKLQIGGYNPDSIMIQHQYLRQTDGDIYFYAPSDSVQQRNLIQKYGANALLTCRDGLVATSYYANVVTNCKGSEAAPITNFNPTYNVNIDGSDVFSYPLGSAPVNALHYTLLRSQTIGYPDFMFSDKNRGLFRMPSTYPRVTIAPDQYAYVDAGGVELRNWWYNTTTTAHVSRGFEPAVLEQLHVPSSWTVCASRGLFFVPILPQFQNGSQFTMTQTNGGHYRHSFFAHNAEPTDLWNATLPKQMLRTAILHCALKIHVTPTDSIIEYEYPSGKYIRA